jgi:dolichol-phosphate mannosyltransferase
MAYELAIIIPTFNERENVEPLLDRLDAVLEGWEWEAIFVDDDSTDGTAERIRAIARRRPNVRCLQRIGRRGLAAACIEGMMVRGAPFLAVMDADLQHDERLLPSMLDALRSDSLDIVIASRYADGGSAEGFSHARERLSRLGTRVARKIAGADLSDPLSGFFMLRRELLEEVVRSLSGKGFKILLDIFAAAPRSLRWRELPMQFRPRHSGESKLDVHVGLEFVTLAADRLLGRLVPVRFVLFVLVGAGGLVLHLLVLGLLYRIADVPFLVAQTAAALAAMTANFSLNNVFTYRDRRVRGWRFLRGFGSFVLACSVGALINLLVASFLYQWHVHWMVAGLLGATVGAVWNYGVTSTITWLPSRGS